jgi:hypothetical protein
MAAGFWGLLRQVVHLRRTEPSYFAAPPGLHRYAGLATQPENACGFSPRIKQGDREPERIGAEYRLSYALRRDQLQPLGLDDFTGFPIVSAQQECGGEEGTPASDGLGALEPVFESDDS